MNFEDKLIIDAPADRVWAFLLDPNCIAACMPGVENLTQIDDRTFDADIAASVGPISGKFSFRARIVESNPPREMAAEIDGKDSVTRSTVRASMAMTLDPLESERTAITYRASVDVQGRLAIVGEMILRATASLMVDEFWRRMRAKLAETSSQP